MLEGKHILIITLSIIFSIVITILNILFFKWSDKITCMKDGEHNTVLGYNIAFDYLALTITGLVIIISFILFITEINKDITSLILGISIGSLITRTPSFKEKDKK
jgi:hypothetical protein